MRTYEEYGLLVFDLEIYRHIGTGKPNFSFKPMPLEKIQICYISVQYNLLFGQIDSKNNFISSEFTLTASKSLTNSLKVVLTLTI